MNSETLTSHPPTQPPSNSNWMNSLRSAKGFPDDHSSYTNLDHFLSQTPPPTRHHDVTTPPSLPKHDVITNLLSDLFHFNSQTSSSSSNIIITNKNKKSNRKQMCPRSFFVNVVKDRRDAKKVIRDVNVNEVDEEEECDWEDFTQTEVTVIDTSVSEWKFDKVLYRRKNVWKVGDKKKMRKESANNNNNEDGCDVHKNKKNKLKVCKLSKVGDGEDSGEEMRKRKKKKKKKLKLCGSLKYVDKEDVVVRSKGILEWGHEQWKTTVSAYEKKQDNCSQVQEKRVLKKQIDGGSSVIIIKSIPTTNKRDMSGISKSCRNLCRNSTRLDM